MFTKETPRAALAHAWQVQLNDEWLISFAHECKNTFVSR